MISKKNTFSDLPLDLIFFFVNLFLFSFECWYSLVVHYYVNVSVLIKFSSQFKIVVVFFPLNNRQFSINQMLCIRIASAYDFMEFSINHMLWMCIRIASVYDFMEKV